MAGETAQIHIDPLVLSDTFNTWFDRSNELINSINQNVVWDIAGLTSVQIISGVTGGNYNGVKSIGIALGAGITHTVSGIGLDILGLPTGLTTGTTGTTAQWGGIDPLDYIAIYDTGTSSVRKLEARYAVPYILTPTKTTETTPNVNDNVGRKLWIEGDLVVAGNLTVSGDRSVISSQNIAMEDKNIELAYQQSAFIGITGVSAGTYLQQFNILGVSITGPVGATAYYWVAGVTTFTANTATVIAHVRSITGAFTTAAAGTTGRIEIGSVYLKGDPTDLQTGGLLKIGDIGAAGMTSLVTNEQGLTNSYMSDVDLDRAGLTIKGASGDKQWIWLNNQNVWKGENIGVFSSGYVHTSKFRNDVGLTSTNTSWNRFVFQGSSGTAAKTTVVLASDGEGEWSLVKGKTGSVGLTGETLQLLYLTGSGVPTSLIAAEFTPYTSGPLGITSTAGGSASSWAKYLNADFLDGAGGATAPTPNSIPISDSRGYIGEEWLEASSCRKVVNQTAHGLTTGMAVRYITSTGYTHASWVDSVTSKSVGVVESIPNANSFVVNSGGYVRGLPGTWLANTLYYLGTTGGLTTTYPPINTYYKPTFNCTTTSGEGYIIDDFAELQITGQTDVVYLRGLVPVGTIQAYAGTEAGLPSYDTNKKSWVFCDGRAISLTGYYDLYSVIGDTYYARGKVTSAESGTLAVTMDGGTRGLVVGNLVSVGLDLGTQGNPVSLTSGTVSSVSSGVITVSGITTTGNFSVAAGAVNVRVQGRRDDSTAQSVFFVPDFRLRFPVGASGSQPFAGRIGDTLVAGTTAYAGGLGLGWTGSTTGGSIATNWIIRAQQTLDAVVLTGHNHNTTYVRHDINTQSETSGAIPSAGATARYNARTNIAAVSTETNNTVTGTLAMTNIISATSVTSGALTVAGGVGISGALYVGKLSTFVAGLSSYSLYVSSNSTLVGALTVSGVSTLAGLTASSLDITGTSRFAGNVVFGKETTHGATATFTTITADNIVASTSIRIGAVAGGGSSIVVAGVSTLEGITANYLHIAQGITAIGNLTVGGNTTLAGLTATTVRTRGLSATSLDVSGVSRLGDITSNGITSTGAISTTKNISMDGSLNVGGVSNIAGLTATGNLNIGGTSKFSGNVVFSKETSHGATATFVGLTAQDIFATTLKIGGVNFTSTSSTLQSAAASSLAVSGLITAPTITATTFTGALVGNASTATTVVQPTQSVITRVGTLTELAVSGSLTAAASLSVVGVSTLAGVTATSLWVSGGLTAASTLRVVGVSTLAGVNADSLAVVGVSTLAQLNAVGVNVSGGVTANSTLKVVGASTLAGVTADALNVVGNTTLGTATVVGAATVGGLLTSQSLNVSGVSTLGQANAVGVNVSGGVTANSTLKVVGVATLSGVTATYLYVSGGVTASFIDILGNGYFAGKVGIGIKGAGEALEVVGTIISRGDMYSVGTFTSTSINMRPPVHGQTGGATSHVWKMQSEKGMFNGGAFSSTGLTSIAGVKGLTAFTMNATSMGTPNGVYTIDPGCGIQIESGTVITIETGYNWKIL